MSDSIPTEITNWLLAEGDPWVRYRTMRDLLGRSEGEPEVKAARNAMLSDPRVRGLTEEVSNWPGYPLKRHNDASHPLHKLAVLADFGLRADDPGMAEILNRVMAHQAEEGAFQLTVIIHPRYGGTGEEQWAWFACDAPTILYALLAMGLGDRKEVQKAVEHLRSIVSEKGCLCVNNLPGNFRGPGRKADPCPYANLLIARAFAQIPEVWDTPACHNATEVLLWHWEHQKERRPYLFGIGTTFRKLKYPSLWYDILAVADALSRYPFLRKDGRLQEMAKTLMGQADDMGRFTPSSVWRAWKSWEFSQKKVPSPWVTFLAWRIQSRLEETV